MHQRGGFMNKTILSILSMLCITLLFTTSALAVPFLQLDASDGGYIGGDEESIQPTTNPFTLYALVDPSRKAWDGYGELYYLSIALISDSGPVLDYDPSEAGFFTITGFGPDPVSSVDVPASAAEYGIPPLGLDSNPGLLGPHDVFPTYYWELGFNFDPGKIAEEYNTQDNPGGLVVDDVLGLNYRDFVIALNLNDGYHLHFDLYNKDGSKIDKFAPFSHDVTTNGVPEPSTVLLLGLGLIGLAGLSRKRLKN
jgi:hypothetical protein